MTKATFKRHMSALLRGEVGPAFIRGVTRAMRNADFRRKGYTHHVGMDDEQLLAIWTALLKSPPRIEQRQAEKGLHWLRRPPVWRKLSERERSIVDDFDHFELIDFIDYHQSYIAQMTPVYRVHAKDGRTFSYYAGSWQSNVPFTVLR